MHPLERVTGRSVPSQCLDNQVTSIAVEFEQPIEEPLLTVSTKTIKPVYTAPALEKGLEIIEYLSAISEPQSMVPIANALGRSKHEIYRMLHVLENRGYIQRSSDERFSVTNKLFELGMRNPPISNLHDVALPLMHDLAAALGQSCQLVVRSGDQIVVVARVESPMDVGLSLRIGYRRHVMQSTSGRILYAFQPRPEKQRLLPQLLEHVHEEVDVDDFLHDAETAQQEGCIAHDSDFVDGVVDIGAPIFDATHLGAIASLTVPFMRMRYAQLDVGTAIEKVKATAGTISARLQVGT